MMVASGKMQMVGRNVCIPCLKTSDHIDNNEMDRFERKVWNSAENANGNGNSNNEYETSNCSFHLFNLIFQISFKIKKGNMHTINIQFE